MSTPRELQVARVLAELELNRVRERRGKPQGKPTYRRNYGAMLPPKLASCFGDMSRGHGDAVDVIRIKGGDLSTELSRCTAAMMNRGMSIRWLDPKNVTVDWTMPSGTTHSRYYKV